MIQYSRRSARSQAGKATVGASGDAYLPVERLPGPCFGLPPLLARCHPPPRSSQIEARLAERDDITPHGLQHAAHARLGTGSRALRSPNPTPRRTWMLPPLNEDRLWRTEMRWLRVQTSWMISTVTSTTTSIHHSLAVDSRWYW